MTLGWVRIDRARFSFASRYRVTSLVSLDMSMSFMATGRSLLMSLPE